MRKLRALVILPTRELVQQVHDVFDHYCHAVQSKHAAHPIKVLHTHPSLHPLCACKLYVYAVRGQVGTASGAQPLAQEQAQLIRQLPTGEYISLVDILITTPGMLASLLVRLVACSHTDTCCGAGRLMEHMGVSSGFTLAHLRFVVIDEADRLLGSATAMASITELLNHLESCTKMVC